MCWAGNVTNRDRSSRPGGGNCRAGLKFWPYGFSYTPPMPASVPEDCPRKPMLRFIVLLALAAMLAMHGWEFFRLRQEVGQGYPDFTAFYSAGKCVVSGRGTEVYTAAGEARFQQEFAAQVKIRQSPLPFTHPPFEAALFAPLALLPYQAAYWIWNGLSVLALLGLVALLRPYVPNLSRWSRALPIVAALAFFPVFVCLVQGQDSLVLLLLFGCAFVAMDKGNDFAAGVLLGMALFRFQLVLPLIMVVALRRRWKVVGGFAVAAVALAAVSIPVVGWTQVLGYPQELLRVSHSQGSAAMNPKNMPNLRGLLVSFLGENSLSQWLTALLSLALLALAAWKWQAEPRQPEFRLGFGLAITVAVMVSYHLMGHDLSLLLLPLMLAADWLCTDEAVGTARRLLIPAIGLLFFSPLYFLLWFRYQRASAMFWVVALLALGLTAAEKRAGTGQAHAAREA